MKKFKMKPGNYINLMLVSSLLLINVFLFQSCAKNSIEADLVLMKGKIVTLSDSIPKVSALAVKGDTILAIGNEDEIEKYIGKETKVINLKGRLAIPGFIESHAHFMGLGRSKQQLDLRSAKNWDEIIALVVAKSENVRPGDWIVGRGWHQEKWDPVPEINVEGYPFHTVLSSATPYNPVLLTHASGHALFANQQAMDLAGINAETPNPRGGRIVRDSLNNILGVFEEEAEQLITNAYKDFLNRRTPEQIKEAELREINLAAEECLSKGITTFHDAGADFKTIDLYKELADSNLLKVRLFVMVFDEMAKLRDRLLNYKMIGYGGNHLTVRAIKKYIDGALGSRGAWMLQPYNDLQDYYGLNTTSIKELKETAQLALENGFQMCTHAIGDRGNREILNIYEEAFKKYPPSQNLRWRIEHAQHLDIEEIKRIKELNIITAMQGIHCTSDAGFVIERLGHERAKRGAYIWRTLIDAGILICNGTDAPVEDVSPIQNFYSSVTRKLPDGSTFFPEQKMTREEALRSYTINGAIAAFEEEIKGSLERGKLADITILSNDILTIPESQISQTDVMYTIVGGKILYEKGKD